MRLVAGLAFVALVLTACDSTAESSAETLLPTPSTRASDDRAAVAVPRTQVLTRDWSAVPWAPAGEVRAPSAQAELPDVLSGGPPAVLAFHPLESPGDDPGWAGERLYFFGHDGHWRRLDLADLGLPESSWPGADTYGPGALSADGRTWAGQTNAGVVLVDLVTGGHLFVAFPRTSPNVRHVSWLPHGGAFSAYARPENGRRYTTFTVTPQGAVSRQPYDASSTVFDTDGTPIDLSGTVLPPRFRRVPTFTKVGLHSIAVVPPTPSLQDPQTVWVFDKTSGEAIARLRTPPATQLVGWTDDGRVLIYVANRRLVQWDPANGDVARMLDVPGPYPGPGDLAASTVALPGL